jgi:thioredoxin 2
VVLKWIPREYPTLAVRFNVRGIPNFTVFSGGRLVMQQDGAVDHDQMNQVAEGRRCGFCLKSTPICN